MHTKTLIMILSVLAITDAFASPLQEKEAELKYTYIASLKKAHENYNSKFEICIKNEKLKTPLKISDIEFLKKQYAQTMIFIEKKHRLSTCIYPEENIVIRKHIETLSLLRSEKILPTEEETLTQTIDIYFGLENKHDLEFKKKYELIPEELRKRFDRVVKDKSLEINFVKITDALPE
ncbi:hypothetical protein AWM79_16395 [Pseudomonas agarici]|uniref:Large T antigen polyomavirus C-terminal domain-containing protein n=1 Tax=Pseudomonas agarici TaxID=46677 RepID=A0A0X1T4A8_PSEAA|nr:hypothetical protein [Pseudomonas agarici]AMB86792.1 hypothetical protein AWM79_16395 [Pseudomonas agarici]NWB90804.1 hypothetical protein [Pseudomonas agarici]